ncbi:MAG: alpha-hydroxy acid oxidase [Spirosomataceae bacterium]
MTDLSALINLFDIQAAAKECMSSMAYEYVESGAADELTVRWNREAFERLQLLPRVLVDASRLDTRVTLFGTELAHPILVAPSAFHRLYHPEGELATAQGAGMASAAYVVSSYTTTPLEQIASVATSPLWFQLYVQDDRSFTKDLILRAEANGCKALCITVDTPTTGPRDRQAKANFHLPEGLPTPYMIDLNLGKAARISTEHNPLTWDDIAWMKSFTSIPVLLKGILHPADAELAVQAGADGIVVSNHGGRNLDTVPATAEVMPSIADQVAGRVPLLMDGGIRRGTDVLKALALGAQAVLVGRPICYGLAAGGAEGVARTLSILQKELAMAMALTGKTTLSAIDRSVIQPRSM